MDRKGSSEKHFEVNGGGLQPAEMNAHTPSTPSVTVATPKLDPRRNQAGQALPLQDVTVEVYMPNRTARFPLTNILDEHVQHELRKDSGYETKLKPSMVSFNMLMHELSRPKYDLRNVRELYSVRDLHTAHELDDKSSNGVESNEGKVEIQDDSDLEAAVLCQIKGKKYIALQLELVSKTPAGQKRKGTLKGDDQSASHERGSKRQKPMEHELPPSASRVAMSPPSPQPPQPPQPPQLPMRLSPRKQPMPESAGGHEERVLAEEVASFRRRVNESGGDAKAKIPKDTEDSDSETEDQRRKREEREQRDVEVRRLNARARDDVVRQKGKAMERCTVKEWEVAELFFGLKEGTFKEGKAVILPDAWDIPGQWFPYQLAEVYQLYKTELSDRNGFVFGNMMGLGKTRVCWGIILVGHIHLLMWLDRQDNPSGHLPLDASASDLSIECPSQSKYPFTCFCNPQSCIYKTVPRLAPTLASGSGKAIEAWKLEVRSMGLLGSKWCSSSVSYPLRVCAMDKSPIDDMQPLQGEELVEARVKVDPQPLLDRENKNVKPRGYTLNHQMFTETVPWKLSATVKNHPWATSTRPSPTSGRFILLSGEHSLRTRIWERLDTMSVNISRTIHVNRGIHEESNNLCYTPCMVWGRTIFDEFHNSKGELTQFSRLYDKMRKSNRGYQWKSWALSGTPMENGLSEILIFITKALRGLHNWTEDVETDSVESIQPRWKRPEYKAIGKMADPRNNTVLNGELMARNWKKMSEDAKKHRFEDLMKTEKYNALVGVGANIISAFMLRRTLETRDPWGRAISRLPGRFEPKIRPCRNPKWANIISEAARKCVKHDSENAVKDAFTRSDMAGFASFPGQAIYKAELMAANGEDELDCLEKKEIQSQFCQEDTAPIRKYVDMLTAGSAKLEQLFSISDEAWSSVRPNPKYKNPEETAQEPEHLPAKLLVAAYKPVTQLTTYFALKKRYGNANVLALYGNMDEKIRKDRLKQWRDPHGPRIMVISMAYAEAITLTEANHLVLMEPQDRQAKQDQVLFRIYRIGQLAASCYAYILYNPDSDIEVNTLKRQQFKTLSRDSLVENRGVETVVGHQIDWEKLEKDVLYKVDGLP